MKINNDDKKTLIETWKQIHVNKAMLAELEKGQKATLGAAYHRAIHQHRTGMFETLARNADDFPERTDFWEWLRAEFKEAEAQNQKYLPKTAEHEAEMETIWRGVEIRRKEMGVKGAEPMPRRGSSPKAFNPT